MSRIAEYVATLNAAERERFADLIEECRAREEGIATSAARATAALAGLDEQERAFGDSVRQLERLSSDLKDRITRLVLATVPPRGSVS